MSLMIERFGLLYFIAPFLSVVNNKLGLILSLLIGRSRIQVKLQDKSVIKFKHSQFDVLMSLLGCLSYATNYKIENSILEITFDFENYFRINLAKMTYEEQNLLSLLFLGTRYGADFNTNEDDDCKRDKSFKIYNTNGRRVVETNSGIKFFVDSIHPGNTIIETFVNKIHLISSNYNWNNRIVVDVGAECGDTPLFFASLGAKVYAFEPNERNFQDMLENLKLNQQLSEKVIPIQAAIGEDGILEFINPDTSNDDLYIGSGSYVYNLYGTHGKKVKVQGYKLETAREKFEIPNIDLLKMDCKGCQFSLTPESLNNIEQVKIEYSVRDSKHNIHELIEILKKSGFKYIIYRHNPFARISNRIMANIYAKRENDEKI